MSNGSTKIKDSTFIIKSTDNTISELLKNIEEDINKIKCIITINNKQDKHLDDIKKYCKKLRNIKMIYNIFDTKNICKFFSIMIVFPRKKNMINNIPNIFMLGISYMYMYNKRYIIENYNTQGYQLLGINSYNEELLIKNINKIKINKDRKILDFKNFDKYFITNIIYEQRVLNEIKIWFTNMKIMNKSLIYNMILLL